MGRFDPFRPRLLSPPGFRFFSPPSRGAFQLSLTVLVRYRSRDVFSLGSQCLPASHGKTKPWYSGIPAHAPTGYAYGAITLYGGAFQPTSASPSGARLGPNNPTSPTGFPAGFGLGSPPFGRPYSGDPCWFLFLPLLRCFRSGGSHSVLPWATPKGFPSVMASSAMTGSPIRRSRVRRLRAPTPGISPLAASFLGARAEPSTGRLSVIGLPVPNLVCATEDPCMALIAKRSCPSSRSSSSWSAR